jgi:N6-adenosine-specific RNA methylase IME4
LPDKQKVISSNLIGATIFPDKKYDIIYADPPWTFKNYNDATADRWVGDQYGLLSLEGIKNLPVKDIASDNSVLLLWATFPTITSAFEVINAWGFTYKTVGFVWVKKNKIADSLFWGMGYWTRSNAEVCLLATRGKPSRVSAGVHQVVQAPVGKHSSKPVEVRERIVELCGDVPRIELFAREQAQGWDAWGQEIDSLVV